MYNIRQMMLVSDGMAGLVPLLLTPDQRIARACCHVQDAIWGIRRLHDPCDDEPLAQAAYLLHLLLAPFLMPSVPQNRLKQTQLQCTVRDCCFKALLSACPPAIAVIAAALSTAQCAVPTFSLLRRLVLCSASSADA